MRKLFDIDGHHSLHGEAPLRLFFQLVITSKLPGILVVHKIILKTILKAFPAYIKNTKNKQLFDI